MSMLVKSKVELENKLSELLSNEAGVNGIQLISKFLAVDTLTMKYFWSSN